jgi:glycosyltransferase involved in cell wall biosynthesis
MTSQIPLSVFLITLNEADRLADTLNSVKSLSDDIVIIDSGSTDGTQALAQSFGARVYHHDWQGYGLQKRFGEDQCRHDWLLNLDADEVLSPDLIAEIRSLFADKDPQKLAYILSMQETFPGEPAPHRWAYAVKAVRLYHKTAGRYSTSTVHDRVQLNPGIQPGRLIHPVYHYSVRSLGEQIEKLNHYSTMQARDLDMRQKTIPTWRLVFEFPAAFLKAYFIRRHCLRGFYGYLTAMNYAFSRHLRLAKHWERRKGALRGRAKDNKQESDKEL